MRIDSIVQSVTTNTASKQIELPSFKANTKAIPRTLCNQLQGLIMNKGSLSNNDKSKAYWSITDIFTKGF